MCVYKSFIVYIYDHFFDRLFRLSNNLNIEFFFHVTDISEDEISTSL